MWPYVFHGGHQEPGSILCPPPSASETALHGRSFRRRAVSQKLPGRSGRPADQREIILASVDQIDRVFSFRPCCAMAWRCCEFRRRASAAHEPRLLAARRRPAAARCSKCIGSGSSLQRLGWKRNGSSAQPWRRCEKQVRVNGATFWVTRSASVLAHVGLLPACADEFSADLSRTARPACPWFLGCTIQLAWWIGRLPIG